MRIEKRSPCFRKAKFWLSMALKALWRNKNFVSCWEHSVMEKASAVLAFCYHFAEIALKSAAKLHILFKNSYTRVKFMHSFCLYL